MDEERIDYSAQLRRGDPVLATYTVGGKARTARRDVLAISGDRGGVEYRSLDDPLDHYIVTGLISERQYLAGNELRRIWGKSNQSPFAQGRYNDQGRGGLPQLLPIGIWSAEYKRAIESVRGERERVIVHRVCCEYLAASRGIEFGSRRTAQRRGMIYLKSALDQLADFFRIR